MVERAGFGGLFKDRCIVKFLGRVCDGWFYLGDANGCWWEEEEAQLN